MVGGKTGSSSNPFIVTFPTVASITSGSLASKVDFSTGTSPYGVAIGDIDGDGKPDLVVSNPGSHNVSVLRNTSSSGSITSGSFAAKVDFATGTGPHHVAIGDIDGDGKLDLAVACNSSNVVSVFRNTSSPGSISFAAKVDFVTGSGPFGVAIGDIDGDGRLDLAVASNSSNVVSAFRNTSSPGSISFVAKVDFVTGSGPYGVAIGDIDGDGKPELVVTNLNSNTVSVLGNTSSSGSITFAANVEFATGTFPAELAIGDIDGDGKPDLAVANGSDNTVSVLRNTSSSGSITFSAKVDLATGTTPRGVAIGDIDGDGNPDLAVANRDSYTVSVFRNTSSSGSIIFSAKVDFTTGATPFCVAIGDIDGDGKPDLVVAENGPWTVSVLRNTPQYPPSITSFTPALGPIGTSVTIAGTNFSATAANNIVFFGATKATVTGASTTQLTVTVPAGATYQSITVMVGGLTGYSSKPFVVTFASVATTTSGSLAPKVDFVTGLSPVGVAIGDIDGDGKPDLVVSNPGDNTVSVFRNTSSSGSISSSSFAAHVVFATGTNPYGVAIGDIDGDGKLDFAVANYNSNTVSVFRNTSSSGSISSGSFAAKVDFVTGSHPYGVAIGDVDGDGKPDLVVTNPNDNTVSVFRNTSSSGSITLAGKVDLTTGTYPVDVAIGDIDGDGKPDLAVTNGSDNTVSVFRNTSSVGSITLGSFAAKVDLTTGTSPYILAIGDIDRDGKPDLVATNYGSNTVSVLRNTSSSGSITFDAKVDFTTGSAPYGVAIGDIDGDGKPDLAIVNHDDGTVSVFRNTSSPGSISSGSFAAKVDFTTGISSFCVAIGDIDGDGKPDLAVAVNGAGRVSVIQNIIPTPPPSITSFAPVFGPVGTTVTINGANFSGTAGNNNVVFFGATRATVTGASTTQLTVTVPAGATYQPISVTVGGLTGYSSKPFIVTVSTVAPFTSGSMESKVDFTTGTAPYVVAISDIDGDGKTDLVVVNRMSSSVSVFRNTSSSGSITSGSFAAEVHFNTGPTPNSVAIGDIDGDGKPDLVVVNSGSNRVSVFRNTSSSGSITSGSFAAKVDFTTGTSPYDVAIGDIDGDGKPDLAVVNDGSNTVSVFRNTSSSGSITSGSFAAKVDFTTGSNPDHAAIGDIDGDGKPDLAVTNYNSNTVSVFRNTSSYGSITSGSFAAKVDFTTGMLPFVPAIGDIDGDGKPDLVVANAGNNTVSVFRNTSSSGSISSGSFAAKVDFTTGMSPYGVAIGDIDGDGKPDLAATNYSSNTVSVYRNTSSSGSITSGSFAAKVDFATGTNPYSVAIGDLDGDGRPDLVASDRGSDKISVLHASRSVSLSQSVVTVSIATVQSGSTVTITLQAKDAADNNLTTGGLTVAFSLTGGGTSSGTIGSVTDNGNGTYSATFTGTTAGTAKAISATIGGSAVTSTSPTITVTAGAVSMSQSIVTISASTVASGSTATITLQARDGAGNNLTTGGLTVTFSLTGGGTSNGSIGSVTYNGDGTYCAAFTGTAAGTARTLSASIGGSAVTSTMPTITVTVGAASLSQSIVTVSPSGVASGLTATITLQAKDGAGNYLTTGGLTVAFSLTGGGTSSGTIGSVTDNANGTYGAIFTGTTAGTAKTVLATIGGSAVTSTSPMITVTAGAVSMSQSIVTISALTVASGSAATITLQTKDAAGNNLTTGGLTVAFSLTGGGTSSGAIGTVVDNHDGTFSALFTASTSGTPKNINATIGGSPVTSTQPSIRVTSGAASRISVYSGDAQSGAINTALPNPIIVIVTDAAGNPVAGTGLTFVFASFPSGATGQSINSIGGTSDVNGQVSVLLTLGSKTGVYSVVAFSGSLVGSPLQVTAIAKPGPPTTMAMTSGNNQTGVINSTLANGFVLTVTDAGGNPVPGVILTFGFGSAPPLASGQGLDVQTTATNAKGQAGAIFKLGSKVGVYTVTATSIGLSGSPVAFSATATVGAASAIAITSGNNQAGLLATAISSPLGITVADSGGNPVPGVSVTFVIAGIPAGAVGQSLTIATVATDQNGQASTLLTLGNKAGTYSVTAAAAGLSGASASFSATAMNPVPTVSSISLNRAGRGSKIALTISGTNFIQGVTTADFGSDITVNSLNVIGGNQIAANLTVNALAALGPRDVAVSNPGPGGGKSTLAGAFTVDTSPATSVESKFGAIPEQYSLLNVFPNPFNPSTTIQFGVPERSMVKLEIFSLLGDKLATLMDGAKESGFYQIQWTANTSSGTYFVRFEANSLQNPGKNFLDVKRLLLLK